MHVGKRTARERETCAFVNPGTLYSVFATSNWLGHGWDGKEQRKRVTVSRERGGSQRSQLNNAFQ